MKKWIGILGAGAMLAAVCLPLPARAQSEDMNAPAAAPAPTQEPAPAPIPPPSAPSDEPASLTPLSDLSDTTSAAPAEMANSKQVTHHKHKRKSSRKKKRTASSKLGEHTRIRTAQIELTELGYRPGAADGVMGRKTKAALKEFQRDHHLRADGVLGPATYDALTREAGSRNPMRSSSAPPESFFAAHPDYYGYYGPDYANPTIFGSPQMIPNRFGNMELDQQQTGQTYHDDVMFNGKSVFHADNQPAAINVSRTFNLPNADAIVLTSYASGDAVCPYRHSLLVLRANGNGLHQIANCTKAYQAFTENGILFISFPGDHAGGWQSGDMWRYENGSLEKL